MKIKKISYTLGICLLMAGAAQAAPISLSFADLNTALSGNSLLANGSATGVGVSGAFEGTATLGNHRYSVTYTGADYDGDTFNDTLTFDVKVDAFINNTIGTSLSAVGTGTSGSASIIGLNRETGIIDDLWVPNSTADFRSGYSLEFSIENLLVTTTLAGTSGSAVSSGFTQVDVKEYSSTTQGDHVVVYGSGTGLFERYWSDGAVYSDDVNVGTGALYVSSASAILTADEWGVQSVDFGIDVTVIPEPATLGLIAFTGVGVLAIRRFMLV